MNSRLHNKDRQDIFLPLTSVVLLCVAWAMMYGFTVDDAFISFRYAEHFVAGHGLVFNIGERIEGFSNPLWVLLMVAGIAIGMPVVMLAKILGLLFAICIILVLDRFARSVLDIPPTERLMMTATLAVTPQLAYYAACGLETTFYAAEVTLFAYYLVRVWRTGNSRDLIAAALIAALAMLTRPEAPLLLIPLAITAYRNKRSLIATIRPLLIPVIALIALVSFRFVYFGEFLPNTFGAKISGDLSLFAIAVAKSKRFAEYTMESFDYLTFIPVLATLGMYRLGRRSIPILLVLLPLIFFVWFASGDWMGLGRFYLPILPLLFLLAYYAMSSLLNKEQDVALWKKLVVGAVPLLLIVAGLVESVHQLRNNYGLHSTMHSTELAKLTSYIERTTPAKAVIAAPEIGRLGYHNDFNIIDLQGLTDTAIARMVQHSDYSNYTTYVLDREPELVMLYDKDRPRDTAMYPLEKSMIQAMNVNGQYRLDTVIPLNYFKKVYLYRRFLQ